MEGEGPTLRVKNYPPKLPSIQFSLLKEGNTQYMLYKGRSMFISQRGDS
jgi:hypothetical protein